MTDDLSFKNPNIEISNLKKIATQLKKEKKFDEAAEKIKEAIDLSNKEGIGEDIKTYLRIPKYYIQAKKFDKAWSEFNEISLLFAKKASCFGEVCSNQNLIQYEMATQLIKEGKNKEALKQFILSFFNEIQSNYYYLMYDYSSYKLINGGNTILNSQEFRNTSDKEISQNKSSNSMEEIQKIYETARHNDDKPIFIYWFEKQSDLISKKNIKSTLQYYLKKTKLDVDLDLLIKFLQNKIKGIPHFDASLFNKEFFELFEATKKG